METDTNLVRETVNAICEDIFDSLDGERLKTKYEQSFNGLLEKYENTANSDEKSALLTEIRALVKQITEEYVELAQPLIENEVLKQRLNNKFKIEKKRYQNGDINLKWLIDGYNKDSLKWLAKDYYGIKGTSRMNKSELVDVITAKIQDPKIFKRKLATLDDSAISLLEKVIAEGGIAMVGGADTEDYVLLEMADMLFNLSEDLGSKIDPERNIFCVPPEMMELYSKYCNKRFHSERRKTVWFIKCMDAAAVLYGVLDWETLLNLYRIQYDGSVEDLKDRFDEIFNDSRALAYYGDLLKSEAMSLDDAEYLLREQADKTYYYPSKEEIIELSKTGVLLSSRAARQMIDTLKYCFDLNQMQAEMLAAELYEGVNWNQRLQDVLNDLEEYELVFRDESDFSAFAASYMEFHNSCRIMQNRGWTPDELAHQVYGSAMNVVKKAVKIGRNAPCPCGSGKKYKNCCGRLN